MKNSKAKIRTRVMQDSMGEVNVPLGALYGAQTQRAVNNFTISGKGLPPQFIKALALIKWAAADTNKKLGLLPAAIANAISKQAKEISNGEHQDHFPVDVYQTGSGTSSNMNMNEVLATMASKATGKTVLANDHVNMGQSSNDTIPTTIHVSAAIEIKTRLLPELKKLSRATRAKANSLSRHVKTGRTHLMDAMPLTMQQELGAWASQLDKCHARISDSLPRLQMIAQGGTAVGSGINTHPRFARAFATRLSTLAGVRFKPNSDFFESLACQDTAVEVSGQLKTLAVCLMKIANDLRWMNSGPLAGLGEIQLESLQPGSSIMPGKVNPVIPEACAMVSAQVIGNDTTISIAGQAGNFQLNVMLPVVAHNLLESIDLLASVLPLMTSKAIRTFKPCPEKLKEALSLNPILVTALNPVIGYLAAAKIAKLAYAQKRPILDVAAENTTLTSDELVKLLDPSKLAKGGLA